MKIGKRNLHWSFFLRAKAKSSLFPDCFLLFMLFVILFFKSSREYDGQDPLEILFAVYSVRDIGRH